MGQSQIISDEAEYYRLVADPTRCLQNWHILSDDLIQLEFKQTENFVNECGNTNIFVATFTTAHARMRLYSVLDDLQERVCYYDTDSVVYIARPDAYDPPLGDYLGDLTDELDGDHIVEFVSAGPKNYSYRTSKDNYCCKVKGFSLNHKNSLIINFHSMKDEVFRYCAKQPSQAFTTTNVQICRNKYEHTLFTKTEQKKYSVVYDKRVVLPNMDTRPYGY